MDKQPTKRQIEVLEYIKVYRQLHKYSPSMTEIKKHLGLKAVSTIHEHIQKLKQLGLLAGEARSSRQLVPTTSQKNNGKAEITIDLMLEKKGIITNTEGVSELSPNTFHSPKKILVKDVDVSLGFQRDDIITTKYIKTYAIGDLVIIRDGRRFRIDNFHPKLSKLVQAKCVSLYRKL